MSETVASPEFVDRNPIKRRGRPPKVQDVPTVVDPAVSPSVEASEPSCFDCEYLRQDLGKETVLAKRLHTTILYPCRRYPQEVLKEATDMCGEFKAKGA